MCHTSKSDLSERGTYIGCWSDKWNTRIGIEMCSYRVQLHLTKKFAIHQASFVYILNDHMYSTFIISMSNLVHSISELFASLGNCTESLCKLGEQLIRPLSRIGL